MKLFDLLFKPKKKNSNPFALPITAEYTYEAENLPRILKCYNVFTDSFLDSLRESYLKNIPTQKFEDSDLLPGIERGYAFWVLNHCLRIVSARKSVVETLENAESAEVKYIDFEVFRPCPNCKRIPKNKRYKLSDSIPIYPCEDCKEDNICLFAYNLRW